MSANSTNDYSQKFAKPKITFPRWGNSTMAFKAAFESLGLEVILAEKTNPRTIAEGAKISPEMYCFPLKVNMGNYLSALRKGANTIFMIQNVGGSCRQRYYGIIQEKALKEQGWQVNLIDFRALPHDIYFKLKKISGASFWRIAKGVSLFFKKLQMIESLERKAQYLRPRELKKGETDEIFEKILKMIDEENDLKKMTKLKKEISQRISKIEIDAGKNIPRVGIIGEIYTTSNEEINFDLEKKLGLEGIEVHREMDIIYYLRKGIFLWKDWLIQRKINPYLKSTVGGHGRDAIYEMLDYVKKDFDGIIHLLPFGCMPEVTVRPILEKIHQESRIPFLSLSLDEQVAEAGIQTRLEAFVDVVKNYYQKKHSNI